MSDDTKEKAMAKIATFNPKIGYPDKWKDYGHVEIRRDAFFEDVIAGRKFVEEDDRATIGKTVDRGRWGMTPPTSDAYYNPLLNEIVFPAGILQPPAFDMNAVDAVNYGAIGVVIGHEISHVANGDMVTLTLIQGIVMVYAVLVILSNLAVDLIYAVLDPRVRVAA